MTKKSPKILKIRSKSKVKSKLKSKYRNSYPKSVNKRDGPIKSTKSAKANKVNKASFNNLKSKANNTNNHSKSKTKASKASKATKVTNTSHNPHEIIAITELNPKQEKRQELINLFKKIVKDTRKEKGNLMYNCCGKTESDHLIIFQRWTCEEDFENHKHHFRTKHFGDKLNELIEGKVIIQRCPLLID